MTACSYLAFAGAVASAWRAHDGGAAGAAAVQPFVFAVDVSGLALLAAASARAPESLVITCDGQVSVSWNERGELAGLTVGLSDASARLQLMGAERFLCGGGGVPVAGGGGGGRVAHADDGDVVLFTPARMSVVVKPLLASNAVLAKIDAVHVVGTPAEVCLVIGALTRVSAALGGAFGTDAAGGEATSGASRGAGLSGAMSPAPESSPGGVSGGGFVMWCGVMWCDMVWCGAMWRGVM